MINLRMCTSSTILIPCYVHRLWQQNSILPSTMSNMTPSEPETIQFQIRIRYLFQTYSQLHNDDGQGYKMVDFFQDKLLAPVSLFQGNDDCHKNMSGKFSQLDVPKKYLNDVLFPEVFNFTEAAITDPENRTRKCIGMVEVDILTIQLDKFCCSHAFHSECIVTWLKKSPLCPLCRQRLTRYEEATEVESGEREVYVHSYDVWDD